MIMIEQEDSLKYLNIAKRLIGETVNSVSNSQYFFNGERNDEDLGDVEIHTSSDLKVCCKVLGDAESVGAYEGELQVPASFEVAEGAQASWEKLPIMRSSEVIGKKIIVIDAMYV